jgi:hypothetical protein
LSGEDCFGEVIFEVGFVSWERELSDDFYFGRLAVFKAENLTPSEPESLLCLSDELL